MPAIYLLRHGKTAANLENRFAGRTGEPLHPDGIVQLEKLGERFAEKGVGRVVAGPLPRTIESAMILGRRLGVRPATAEVFNEIFIPHWDGLTKEEIRSRFGPEYPSWLERPQDFRVDGCETLIEVQQRSVAGIEALFASPTAGATLVVSHLIVLRCLVLHYRQQPLADFRSIKIDNGAVVCLERNGAGETAVRME